MSVLGPRRADRHVSRPAQSLNSCRRDISRMAGALQFCRWHPARLSGTRSPKTVMQWVAPPRHRA